MGHLTEYHHFIENSTLLLAQFWKSPTLKIGVTKVQVSVFHNYIKGNVICANGANPWKLETPDIAALALSAETVLSKQEQFRRSARRRAELEFSLDQMVDAYLKVLLED